LKAKTDRSVHLAKQICVNSVEIKPNLGDIENSSA
jgi:hypothetical protein